MTTLDHSPANIMQALLVALGALGDPSGWATGIGAAWPGFYTKEPNSPDNCVTLYNTAGQSDGRSMIDGELAWHAGLQLRVRSTDDATAWAKASSLRDTLAKHCKGRSVTIGTAHYTVWAAGKIGTVLSAGQDVPKSKRVIYTVNFMAAITQR